VRLLSPEEIAEIEHELPIFPHRSAAAIEALRIVQKHRRWVSDEAIRDIAEFLHMSASELDGVATFYNMIYRRPVGKHVIHVCDSVSCWLMGYEPLRQALEKKLGVRYGETTADGRFTLLPIPCLGTCDRAPAMFVGEDLYRDLKAEDLDAILAKYE
jgi:NADH-quinone oxidoreductase subunit E